MPASKPANTDAYIASFPSDVQEQLQELRAAIHKAAPGAEETISYNMPAFMLNGILVWFAAHTGHIGFYPRAAAIEHFHKELAGYKVSKGTIQFPLHQPLPISLVTTIVKYRVKENTAKQAKAKIKP